MAWINAGNIEDISIGEPRAVRIDKDRSIALFNVDGHIYATDNQCPHMGFPLTRGLVRNGVLTCDWHGRSFDLQGGGCFNHECGDLPVFPVENRSGEIWIDIGEATYERKNEHMQLLWEGLLSEDRWTISKAIAQLLKGGVNENTIIELVLRHVSRHVATEHGPDGGHDVGRLLDGLYIARHYEDADRLITLTTAAAATSGRAAHRLEVVPLPNTPTWEDLERWIRAFSRERQSGRIERCLMTAHSDGHRDQILPLLYSCAVEPHFIGFGDTLIHLSRLVEAVSLFGWDEAGGLVFNLGGKLIGRSRGEPERFRRDAVALLGDLQTHIEQYADGKGEHFDEDRLIEALQSADIERSFHALADALSGGVSVSRLITTLVLSAADRMARTPVNVDAGWVPLTTELQMAVSLRSALQCAGRRVAARGLFHAAWQIFAHRWINIPFQTIAQPAKSVAAPGAAEQAGLVDATIARIKTLDAIGASDAALIAAGSGVDGDALLDEIGRAIMWDDTGAELLSTLRAIRTEWAAEYNHPARSQLLIAIARYAADIRTNKDSSAATETAMNFAKGQTTVDVFAE